MTRQKHLPNLVPPPKVAANARQGLQLREKFSRGGTDVGVRRAQGLAASHVIAPEEAAQIASYFARHAVDKQAQSHEWGDTDNPSAGFIAWLLWGGEEGEAWAKKLKDEFDKTE